MKWRPILLSLVMLSSGLNPGFSQITAFTYQGHLKDGGAAANGSYELTFALFDASVGGNLVSGPLTNSNLALSNGLFSLTLDFGAGAFPGATRWLELAVRTNGSSGPFVLLLPRQPILPAPYSIHANTVNAAGINGTLTDSQLSTNIARLDANLIFSGAVQFTNGNSSFNGTFAGNGAAITGLNATNLAAGTISAARLPVASLDTSGVLTTNDMATFTNVPYGQASASPTPPLGYNPFFVIGVYVSEAVLRRAADYFVTNGFRDCGWKYINMDDGWQAARDTNGVITWNTNRFPNGMPALSSYMHARGLKLGLYTEPTPLSNESSSDPSDYDNYHPGSDGHLEQDAATFAAWGVDYIKFDALPSVPQRTVTERFVSAVQRSARTPIFVGGSIGPFASWMPSVVNSWRNASPIAQGDFHMYAPENALYFNVLGHLDDIAYYPYAVGPGHWNDGDLLPMFNSNPDAFKAVFGMWAMMCSPLILSDLPTYDSEQFRTCTNREALAISQDPAGIQAISVFSNSVSQIWVKPLGTAYGGPRAVALLSRDIVGTNWLTVNWTDIGIPPGVATVRDVWRRHTIGYFTNSFSFAVRPKFAQLLTITPGIIPPYNVGTNSATDYRFDSVSGTTNFPPGGFQYLSTSLNPQFIFINSVFDAATGGSRPMKINGVTYPTGLGVFANADINYFLGGCVSMFHAELGMDDQAGNSVKFQLLLDGKTNYDSGSISAMQPARSVDLACRGATNLTIRVLTTGPNVFGTWGNIANPYFVVAPQAVNTPSVDNSILVSSNGLPVWTTAASLGLAGGGGAAYELTEFNHDPSQPAAPALEPATPNAPQIGGYRWPPNANNVILSWKVPQDRITGTNVSATFSLLTTNAQTWNMAVQYFYVLADNEALGQGSGTLLVPVTSGSGLQTTVLSTNFSIPQRAVWLAVRLRDAFGTTNSGSFWLREGRLTFN